MRVEKKNVNGPPASCGRFRLVLRRARRIAGFKFACGLREFFADFAEKLRGTALRFGGNFVLHVLTQARDLFVQAAANLFEFVHVR